MRPFPGTLPSRVPSSQVWVSEQEQQNIAGHLGMNMRR